MKRTKVCVTAAITAAVAAVTLGAPSASAAPLDTIDEAFDRSIARAEARGIAAETTVRSSSSGNLQDTLIVLPRRTPVTMLWSANPEGESSWTVKQGRRLLGSAGVNTADGAWGTLSSLIYRDPRTFADSRGLSMTTAMAGLDQVWGYDGVEGGKPFAGEPWVIYASGTETLKYLLPATGGRPSQTWTAVREQRGSGGRTIVTARADANATTTCSYPRIRVSIRGGVIESSSWTERCGAVTTTYSTKATYRPKVTKAPARAITEDAAFAIPVPGQDPSWPAVVQAVLATANGAGVQPSTGGSFTSREAVIGALTPMYTIMQAGNPGRIEVSVSAEFPGASTYVITPTAGATSLGVGEDRNAITKVAITVDASGILSRLDVTQRVPAFADPVTSTSTFFPLS